MKKHLLKILARLPLLLGLLTLGFGIHLASAATYGQNCNLAIYPYNPQAQETVGGNATSYLNFLPESECDPHLAYPDNSATGSAYTPQPPVANENPVKAGAENMRIPWAEHQHAYYNDKNSAGDPYYYKSFVDRFEITIQPDGVGNLDFGQGGQDPLNLSLDNLYCVTPVPSGYNGNASAIFDCDGTVSGLWGGTHVTKQLQNGKIVVTWQFAYTSLNKSGRPQVYGNNGSSFTTYNPDGSVNAVLNLNDPYNRELEFAVQFKTKNNLDQIWSATTTSRVLLADLALRKTNYPENFNEGCENNDVNDNNSGWCYLEPGNQYQKVAVQTPSGTHNYFWYPIGSVVSIWKKPAQLINRCTDLTMTPSTVGPLTPTTFHVEPTFENPDAPAPNLLYHWKAEPILPGQPADIGNGQFGDSESSTNLTNPYNDDDKDTYYSGGVFGTVVHVRGEIASSSINDSSEDCQDSFVIMGPPQPAVCQSITLTPATLTAPGSTNLTATVTFNNGQNYQTEVTWSQTGGALTQGEIQEHLSSFPFMNTYVTQGNQGSVTARVTDIQGAQNSPACEQGITVTNVPGKQCIDLNITNPDAQDGVLEITPGQPFTYNFNVQAQTQGNVQLTYRWTDTAANSTFDGQPDPYIDSNTATTYFNPNPQNGTVVNVRGLDVFSGDIFGETCQDQVVLSVQPPNLFCQELHLFVNGQEVDELPINQAVTLTASAQLNTGAPVTSLTWTTNEGTLIPMGACVGQSSGQTITLNPSCPVLFTGGPAGTTINVSSVPSGANCQATLTVPEIPEEECNDLELSHVSDNNYCAYVDPGQYAEDIDWNYTGNEDYTIYNDNRCIHFFDTPENGTLEAEVPGFENVCRDTLNFEAVPPPPPTIEKDVRRTGTTSYSEVVSLSENQNMVEYRIRFTPPEGYPTTTTLYDTISDGPIQGEYPGQFEPLPGTPQPGRIEYRDTMTVSGVGPCQGNLDDASNCYTGEIDTGLKLIKVTVPVTVTYRGEIVDSAITEPNCKAGLVCMEIYNNVVNAPYTSYDENGNEVNESQIMSNIVRVQVFCQYILTRAAGDIFLETDLEQGVDIYKCTPYKSTTGVIITPAPPVERGIISVGPDEIVQIGHEVCKDGGTGALKDVYNPKSTNLSSQICEVKLTPGSSWEKTKIVASIDENKTRISRWEPNLSPGIINNVKFLPPSQTGVYHVKGNLTIDNTGANFIQDGDGAKTFIIEDGDLTIKDNIKIGACNKTKCTLRDTASLAFIVLNGNINIDPDVKEIAGIYFVQKGKDGTGLLYSTGNADSQERLTVYGTIYGDIQPLFKNRKAVGDPGKNEASITIRWDERILLNTPPGLQDIVDIQQNEVAR